MIAGVNGFASARNSLLARRVTIRSARTARLDGYTLQIAAAQFHGHAPPWSVTGGA
jgi:hypothetical protein